MGGFQKISIKTTKYFRTSIESISRLIRISNKLVSENFIIDQPIYQYKKQRTLLQYDSLCSRIFILVMTIMIIRSLKISDLILFWLNYSN